MLHDIPHAVYHIDKGIVYTFKELLLRPGQMINGYWEGKRVKHYNPFSYFILIGGILAFINVKFADQLLKNANVPTASPKVFGKFDLMRWILEHPTVGMYVLIPFFSCASWLVYKKYKRTFPEHLVAYIYIIAQTQWMGLVLMPLQIFVPSTVLYYVSNVPILLWQIWAIHKVFESKPTWKSILRSVWNYILGYLVYMLTAILLGIIIGIIIRILKIPI